jgi:hypothetical protein
MSSPWRGLQGGTGQLPKAGPAQASETAGSDAPPIFEQLAPSELLDWWRNRRQRNFLSGRRSTSPPRTKLDKRAAALTERPVFPFFDPVRTYCALHPPPAFSVGRLKRC